MCGVGTACALRTHESTPLLLGLAVLHPTRQHNSPGRDPDPGPAATMGLGGEDDEEEEDVNNPYVNPRWVVFCQQESLC